mgnify:CR=1 FL=1
MNTRHKLTDEQWNKIKDLLPPERHGKKGRPRTKTSRQVLDAIVWILRTGAPWRDMPEEFGPWQSIYTQFRRWKEQGVWENVFKSASQFADEESIMIDSSVIRAHQHAAGATGGKQRKR